MTAVNVTRLSVEPSSQGTFEEVFSHRSGHVDDRPGFLGMKVLRPGDGDEYLILTEWESREAFHAWKDSREYDDAHDRKLEGIEELDETVYEVIAE